MKYKLILFDFDGTLVDTAPDITASINHVLGKYGFEAKTLEQVKESIGLGVHHLIMQLSDQGLSVSMLEEAVNQFKIHYEKNIAIKTDAYPDVKHVLENDLKDISKAIVTNKPHRFTEILLKELGMEHLFVGVIGTGIGFAPKPKPDACLHLMDQHQISEDEVLFVGDSITDCLTAKHAQVDFAWVSYGYDGRPDGDIKYIFEGAKQWRILANEHV